MKKSRAFVWIALSLASIGLHAQEAMRPLYFLTEPFPPFTFETAGRAAGPMVDTLQAVCARLQRPCRIDVMPWRRALLMAERGQADGLFTVVDIPERRQLFHISSPVLEARYVFFSANETAFKYRQPADLQGRNIGVYGPSATAAALDEILGKIDAAKSVETSNLTALRKLAGGRYGPDGLVLINEDVAANLIASESIPGLRRAGVARQLSYSFGLTRNLVSSALFEQFNSALAAVCESGQTRRIAQQYRLKASPCQRAMP